MELIRPATKEDLEGVVALLERSRRLSVYRDVAGLDTETVYKVLHGALHRQGDQNLGGSLFLVSEDANGRIDGCLIGVLVRLYGVLDGIMATDLVTVAEQPGVAMPMLRELVSWAEDNPAVDEIRLAATDALGDSDKTAALFQRLRLQPYGVIYAKILQREDRP